MVKTNRFDGFGFSFIQIAHLLKKIFPPRGRLVGQMFPHFKEGGMSFNKSKRFVCAAFLLYQRYRHSQKARYAVIAIFFPGRSSA